MDNSADTEKDLTTDQTDHKSATADGSLPNGNRRRFTRNAVVGSAVLFSLGNRAAWGTTVGCMSVATLNSFNPATGAFGASVAPDRPGHNVDLARDIHRIGREPFYGKESGYATCPDSSLANPADGVCIVKGSCDKEDKDSTQQAMFFE